MVDDEKIVLTGLRMELEAEGYEVQTAQTGQTALEIFRHETFDIVYTDLIIPDMTGVDICREIKKVSSHTEVILVSGHPKEIVNYQQAFLAAGGRDEILRKPLGPDELARITAKVLKGGRD